MPSLPDDPIHQLARRITALEEYWTHLERTVQQLDEVLRTVQDRLDRLDKRVGRLGRESTSVEEDESEERE